MLKLDDIYLGMILEMDTEIVGSRFRVISIGKRSVGTKYVSSEYGFIIPVESLPHFREYTPDREFYKEVVKL